MPHTGGRRSDPVRPDAASPRHSTRRHGSSTHLLLGNCVGDPEGAVFDCNSIPHSVDLTPKQIHQLDRAVRETLGWLVIQGVKKLIIICVLLNKCLSQADPSGDSVIAPAASAELGEAVSVLAPALSDFPPGGEPLMPPPLPSSRKDTLHLERSRSRRTDN